MLENYLKLLSKYKDEKINQIFELLPLPITWSLLKLSNEIDLMNDQKDYLLDHYHYRQILKLIEKEKLQQQENEFQHDLNLEEFILMFIKILDIPLLHIPYFINGVRIIYEKICWQCQIHKINHSSLINFYNSCLRGTKTTIPFMFNKEQKSTGYEQFKKEKYGLKFSNEQDITHHNNPIKRVFYCEESILSLDNMSSFINFYNSETVQFNKKIICSIKKRKSQLLSHHNLNKTINILDIFYSDSQKILGACCQDKSISFFTNISKFSQEFVFENENIDLQIRIIYLESLKSWITINKKNKMFKWTFTFLIESNDNKGFTFTNSSIGTTEPLSYSGPQITYLKEIIQLQKLFLVTVNKKVYIWDILKQQNFIIINIPDKCGSIHSISYSVQLDLTFAAGFGVDILVWQFDKLNEGYTQAGEISIRDKQLNSISAIEIFDEQGVLACLDDKGVLRLWDLENQEIVYKFELFHLQEVSKKYQIESNSFQIIKFNIGRLAIITSRINVLEFISKEPRRIRSKFQPQLMFLSQDSIFVSSKNQLIGFDWNSGHIIEKESFKHKIIYFFILEEVTIIITKEAYLQILGGKQSNYKQTKQLFENEKLIGCYFNQLYNLLSCWTKKICKIWQINYYSNYFEFNLIRIIESQTQFYKIQDCLSRDVIGFLEKTNILTFVQFSTMKQLSSITIENEIIDFYLFPDYSCISIITQNKILFCSHQNFEKFQSKFIIFTSSVASIINLNYQSLDNILETYLPNNFRYRHQNYFKEHDEQNNAKYEKKNNDFQIIEQIKKLKEIKKEYYHLIIKDQPINKFRRSVRKIITLLKRKSFEETKRIAQRQTNQLLLQNKQIIDNDSEVLNVRRNAVIESSIQIELTIPQKSIQNNLYKFDKICICEDFNQQYFISYTENNYIIIANLQNKILDQFPKLTNPYYRIDNSKQNIILQSKDEQIIDLINIKEINLVNLIINHDSLSPKLMNFYEHLILITFGKEDGLLKFWDITGIQSIKQIKIEYDYLNHKIDQTTCVNNLEEIKRTVPSSSKIEILEQQIKEKNELVKKSIKLKQKYQGSNNLDYPYLQGEIILQNEQKLIWNLKEFNQIYRVNQMKTTLNLMTQMFRHYQEASQYQIQILQKQIQNQITLLPKIRESSFLNNEISFITQLQNLDKQSEQNLYSINDIYDNNNIQPKLKEQQQKVSTTSISLPKIKAKKKILQYKKTKDEDKKLNEVKSEELLRYEKLDQFLKNAPKIWKELNEKLNKVYHPPIEKEQKLVEEKKLLEKEKKYQKGRIDISGVKLINLSPTATDDEKRQYFQNYSFDDYVDKQNQFLKNYSSHSSEKQYQPFKEYLKETRNIKLNNSNKSKKILNTLKQNQYIKKVIQSVDQLRSQVKNELIAIEVLQKNHRTKLKPELQYIIDSNLQQFQKKESFYGAIIDSQRYHSLSPIKEYLIQKKQS